MILMDAQEEVRIDKQPFESELNLTHALTQRDVEIGDGPFAEDAVRIANDSTYRLSGAVYESDAELALPGAPPIGLPAAAGRAQKVSTKPTAMAKSARRVSTKLERMVRRGERINRLVARIR